MTVLANSISSAAASFELTWTDLICAVNNLQSLINPVIVPKIEAMEKLLFQLKTDLDNFLEEKRVAIPRLFFVADEEVLELFAICQPACTSGDDFDLVAPILEKLYEGVKSVEHDDDFITAMISRFGEKVCLAQPVSFKTSPETWVSQFEESMKVTVELSIQKAYETFDKFENRIEWIKSNSAQASIVVIQIKHAEMVDEAIASQKLNEAVDNINDQLAELTKESLKNLNELDRCTIQNLIIIQVHNRDLLCQMISDFHESSTIIRWQCQLRFYLENGKVIVRMMSWEMNYARPTQLFNYSQLVITPLTDRAYRTIISAKQHHFGAAPQGPAGTGKTETTRDLARALGMNCVVVNSSDQIDEKITAQIFKGALASGSWVCFDEFNRIVNEVLVNVGEQLKIVKEHKEKGATSKPSLNESAQKLCKDSCIAVTMNPGYAGRTELPDNLKPFFRPISMMVPDYALIAEIMLYSSGFQTADVLGKKLTLVHKLCSEQLSSQDHYDYGMRAVKHSVSSAKKLKLFYPDEDETNLLAEALCSLHFGKLVKKDISQFEAIMNDVFPKYQSIDREYNEFKKAAALVCETLGLKATDDFISRVVLTFRTLKLRHGIMIIGKSGTGKTTILKVLEKTLELLSQKNHVQDGEQVQSVDSEILFIKTMNTSELYGSFDSTTKKWSDGKLTKVFRKFSEQSDGKQKWMIFDGPVDAIWVENLNQVLDDNKKLPLANGEVIPATENMRFIFNVQDVACASPATVSRCGFINLSEQFVDPYNISESISDATLLAKFQNKNVMFSSSTLLKIDILKRFSSAEQRIFTSSTTKIQVREMLSSAGDILIIHNINHPLREDYGAQPALEVLREYLENGSSKTIIAFFVRQGVQISPALLRHFEIAEDISLLKTSQKLEFDALKQKLSQQSCNLKEKILNALDLDFLKKKSFFGQMTENNQVFYSSLIFSLCVFHAVVTERANHVPDGWNIPYAFKHEDLVISFEQLESLSSNFKNTTDKIVEIQTLRYLVGECNYGGRISDDKDRRLCVNLLDDFIFSDIADAKFVLNRSFFTDLNLEEKSTKLDEIFKNQSFLSLMSLNESALKNQPLHSAENIFTGFSNFFRYLKSVSIASTCKDSPFSFFVTSELERYKKLVNLLISQMEDFSEAVNGKIQFRESHKRMLASFAKREIPENWKRNSFARSSSNTSMKDFVQELKSRVEYFNAWAENGTLKSYDISKLFFPQSFFTTLLQNFARSRSVSIDEVTFDFKMLAPHEPSVGVMISGLFIVGASFDIGKQNLILNNGSIFNFPEIWVKPVLKKELDQSGAFYECPVYKTKERRGVLSTTGHSTNFLMMLRIPISEEEKASSFVKRGVALLCSKD
ncbi:unnamed protein product [Oikopleura dioica]|uniref:AAA+ ATPase domain-containing protein n=1 Tax=Oikopleura dioica TaxID=34765 RepID=E4XYX1_OIKDI|nr:unnamed protein product [Oikopleura dioica]